MTKRKISSPEVLSFIRVIQGCWRSRPTQCQCTGNKIKLSFIVFIVRCLPCSDHTHTETRLLGHWLRPGRQIKIASWNFSGNVSSQGNPRNLFIASDLKHCINTAAFKKKFLLVVISINNLSKWEWDGAPQ